jgi:hypothetical protein
MAKLKMKYNNNQRRNKLKFIRKAKESPFSKHQLISESKKRRFLKRTLVR